MIYPKIAVGAVMLGHNAYLSEILVQADIVSAFGETCTCFWVLNLHDHAIGYATL
jgi:hypothetical protein